MISSFPFYIGKNWNSVDRILDDQISKQVWFQTKTKIILKLQSLYNPNIDIKEQIREQIKNEKS